MTTATVRLEPQNIAASAQSLKAEFAKANLAGIKTVTRRGAVHVEMPIASLSGYQFAFDREQCSWRTSRRKLVVQLKGFVVEQRTQNKAVHVIFKRTCPEQAPVLKKAGAIREIFFQRSLRAIEELKALDEKQLAQAVQAPTDYSVLVSALNSEEALAGIRAHDPLAGARLRGLEAKRKLIEAEGGALSSAQAARLLRITRQAVDKRRKEGKLLAVELGKKGFRYPAWQFGLSGLEKVLAALKDRDSWEQLAFFLNPSAVLEDRTPLEVLQQGKGDIADVLRAASVYGEQGA